MWLTYHPKSATITNRVSNNGKRLSLPGGGAAGVATVDGFIADSAFPHLRQNWESSVDSVPHLGQNIVAASSRLSEKRSTVSPVPQVACYSPAFAAFSSGPVWYDAGDLLDPHHHAECRNLGDPRPCHGVKRTGVPVVGLLSF
ncbi:MAG: hypothetical protein WB762_21385 [Candidatus Sulfotelmatobacter sp.]